MSKNKKKEKDVNIKTIWKMIRSEKGRKLSFVIFYLFFFIFLFIFIYSSPATIDNNSRENQYSLPFNTATLEQNDYTFKYIVKTDLNELLYFVNKSKDGLMVNDDTGTYQFVYKNGFLTTNSNLNVRHAELLSIFELKRIIKNSKLISETKLNETNEYVYTYKITNSNLSIILHDEVDGKLENEIIVKTDNKKEIREINLDLLNYERELNSNLKKFNITIKIGDMDE